MIIIIIIIIIVIIIIIIISAFHSCNTKNCNLFLVMVSPISKALCLSKKTWDLNEVHYYYYL